MQVVGKTQEDLKRELDALRMEINMEKVYRNLGKRFDINWDMAAPKIVPLLKMFDKKMRVESPEQVLEAALKIAGELKVRDGSLPHVEDSGSSGSEGARKGALDAEVERIQNRILNAGKSKGDNVFGI